MVSCRFRNRYNETATTAPHPSPPVLILMRTPHLIALVFFLGLALDAPATSAGETTVPVWREISGAQTEYEVGPRDTGNSIAARFGEPELTMSIDNDDPTPGGVIDVDNRHIVPTVGDGVVVNVPQRMLYLMRNDHLVGA